MWETTQLLVSDHCSLIRNELIFRVLYISTDIKKNLNRRPSGKIFAERRTVNDTVKCAVVSVNGPPKVAT